MSDTEKTTLARGNLPKLEDDGDSNNYADWEWKMRIVLRHKKVWKYIEGPESNGPPAVPVLDPGVNDADVATAEKALETWQDGDLAAINIFAATLPQTHICSCQACRVREGDVGHLEGRISACKRYYFSGPGGTDSAKSMLARKTGSIVAEENARNVYSIDRSRSSSHG